MVTHQLSETAKALLVSVMDREYWGIGAVPQRTHKRHIITEVLRFKLATSEGYFDSGHPRYALTPCGTRAALLLQELEARPLARDAITAIYSSEPCPLEPKYDDGSNYHSYEHWNED